MGTSARSARARGFTLIELLIVVAIIGVIAAIAIPNLLNSIDRSKQKASMADIRALGAAVQHYAIDNNVYPSVTSMAGLESVLEPTYIVAAPTSDAWSNTFNVQSAPLGFTICSGGKDGGPCTVVGGGGATNNFNDAIILIDGQFAQWPDGQQRE